MTPDNLLQQGLQQLGQTLPQGGFDKLLAYLQLLGKWNKAYNLTAIRDARTAVSHHLLDSLAVLPHLPPGALADIGSGAGLPGIPIALAQPERSVTLNDSNEKKMAFLRQAKIELGLSNVALHAGRAQAWQPEERVDIVISRAFSRLAQFIAASGHLLRPGGCFAAMKGTVPDAELAALPRARVACRIVRLEVPLLAAERHLVLCRKSS